MKTKEIIMYKIFNKKKNCLKKNEEDRLIKYENESNLFKNKLEKSIKSSSKKKPNINENEKNGTNRKNKTSFY